jgi:DNA-directed RNA polymerase specialized sigma24 family protein
MDRDRSYTRDEATDDVVSRAIAAGEFRKALEALICGYQQAIVGFCTQMLGDTHRGQEIAQEVFLGVYQAMPRFHQQVSVCLTACNEPCC